MSPSPGSDRLQVIFVVPCFNEEQSIPILYQRVKDLQARLPDCALEMLFVDDGSTDRTAAVLDEMAESDPAVQVLYLARNAGHQAALAAGLDFADADVVVTIDADLQDPPELLVAMLAEVRQGADVVHAQRRSRAGESWFKLATARTFYALLHLLSNRQVIENCGDFRAVTRPALEAARGFRELQPFHRAIFSNLGFRQAMVPYDRKARVAGETKYPLGKMLRLAVNAFFSHSASPLRVITLAALVAWSTTLLYLGKALWERFVLGITVPGWTSTVALLSFYTGLQLLGLAVLGAYLSRVYEQGLGRPRYWVGDARNLRAPAAASDASERALSERVLAGRRRLDSRLAASPLPASESR